MAEQPTVGGGVVRKIELVVLLILALVNVDCQSRFRIGQGSRLSAPRFCKHYEINTQINARLLRVILDLLLCFGVPHARFVMSALIPLRRDFGASQLRGSPA